MIIARLNSSLAESPVLSVLTLKTKEASFTISET